MSNPRLNEVRRAAAGDSAPVPTHTTHAAPQSNDGAGCLLGLILGALAVVFWPITLGALAIFGLLAIRGFLFGD